MNATSRERAVMTTMPRGVLHLMIVGILVGASASGAAAQPSSESVRARIEQLHEGKTGTLRGVRLLQADGVSHFFQARSFAPAWQGPAVEQILEAIRDIDKDGLAPEDYHLTAIEELRRAPASQERDADLQVLVTDALAALLDHVRFGKVRPVALDRRWNMDPRAEARPLEHVLAELAAKDSPGAAIEALKPSHFIYAGLKKALAAHRAVAAAGGWPPVPAGAALKPGATDPRIASVRRRLAATGELPADSSGPLYDEELATAVKRFQERHRLTADGVIGRATLDALNMTAADTVSQIRVNLERARWVMGGAATPVETFVLVNLAAFKVYLIRDGKNVWETLAQVGRAGRQTPAFRADMRYLVFNPDWTVPPTILAQDVLAPMREGQNAIEKKKLTILDRQGRPVDPASIDWSTASPGNFPYVLRQPPGPDNALGRVKFIFPNEYSIFLHDTPSQELFTADQRTFSSGCIRVQHALDFAAVLLGGRDGWTPERIQQAIGDGRTETVFLDQPLPVLIVYWTVSVGASGELRYARDVYKLDGPVLRALNEKPK
jgi:L,D-transpeptidase YcbB